MDLDYFASAFKKLLTFIKRVIPQITDAWNTEWTLIAVVCVLIIVFIYKDKPVTTLISMIVRSIKGGSRNLKRLIFKALKYLIQQLSKHKKPAATPFSLASLFDALALLTGSHGKRYEVPTYIALSSGVDITELLTNLDAGNREKLLLKEHKEDAGKDWFVFDQGCIISHPSPEKVATELRQRRPERPVDGVVICLSIEQLSGDNDDELSQKAQEIYKQLWALQNEFAFVLPVYILICDLQRVAGFEHFWQTKSLTTHHNEIFGWSNPNQDSDAFNAELIAEAFGQINLSLRQIQLSLIAEENTQPSASALLFPKNLSQYQATICSFCNTIFGDSSYHANFIFQGLYFSGKLRESEHHPTSPSSQKNCSREKFFKKRTLLTLQKKNFFLATTNCVFTNICQGYFCC